MVLSDKNYAKNIIVNLASLPDFLRKPILKNRLVEFFSMSDEEKDTIIKDALEAGPTIPFPNFSKLFKTWLEMVCTLSEEQKNHLFLKYINAICQEPQKIIRFNLDGILEIFEQLTEKEQNDISGTIHNIIPQLDLENKRRLMIIIPDNAKVRLRII